MCLDEIRLKRDGPRKPRQCFVNTILSDPHIPQLIESPKVIGIEFSCAPKFNSRLLQPSSQREHRPQIAMRHGVAGPKLQHRPVALAGAIHVSLAGPQRRHRLMRIRIIRIDFDCPTRELRRFLKLSLLPQHCRKPMHHLWMQRMASQNLAIDAFRPE